mgnify:CR=1 FL=1
MPKLNIDNWIDNQKDNIISDLRRLIAIRSVEDLSAAKEGAPFGDKVKQSLDAALEIGNSLGLKTRDIDGYCGTIEAGNGDELMGILCHVDIVPEGTGWSQDPFAANIVNGNIYGRGTLDDKGPAVAAIYALKAVIESGINLNKRVRIILGCNEETNMKCLKYYKAHEEIPTFSISPDANFPVTNSEKTILNATFEKKYNSKIEMHAGEAANIIAGYASATVDGEKVEAVGTQAHASTPWEGESAILKLFTKLSNMNLEPEDAEVISRLHECLKEECYGESLGLDKEDASGRLTLNVGIVDWDKDGFKITFDLRCPISMAESEVKEKLENIFTPIDGKLTSWNFKPGFSVPDDDPMVRKLLDVYIARTGDKDAKPLHIGGGTYARELPNAVSFGPEGYMCTSSCHVADEHIGVEELLFNVKMIADAIISLCS